MDNYDFKIMNFICSSTSDVVRMSDISVKFGAAGRESAVSLCKNKLLSWAYSEDDIFSHDEYGIIKPTQKGLLEYERFKYNRQLRKTEVWRERLLGGITGSVISALGFIVKEYLWPLILQLLS